MYALPNMEHIFRGKFLKETAFCLQTRRNAHSFLTKEKDPIANQIIFAEDQVVKLYVYFFRIVEISLNSSLTSLSFLEKGLAIFFLITIDNNNLRNLQIVDAA